MPHTARALTERAPLYQISQKPWLPTRAAHIPARYVNGFIEGEGATHAWVEVYDDGAWWGIDPTHNRPIEWGYIKLSHGRDAEDCPVNRGVFTGAASQTAEIRVIVEEL